MAAGVWYPQSTVATVFNDVTPNEEDESTSKTKQPDQICHSLSHVYRRANADRVCSEAKTVTCLS